MQKPTIAITVNYDRSDKVARSCGLGIPGQDFNYVAGDYINAVEKSGGIPLLLPQSYVFEDLIHLLDLCDGILISGGHDVDPLRYGERNLYSGDIAPERDTQDLSIARYAFEHNKPLLGICRGAQIINVAVGGTLYQDIERQYKCPSHFSLSYPRNVGWHSVSLTEGSKVMKIFGKKEIMVNSFHHQAVQKAGNNAEITAYSSDGIPEAIELKNHRFAIGVQWHPEMMYDSEEQLKLFKALIDNC